MKLCLIGSTRFAGQYAEANKQLTLAGHIVYTVATISSIVGNAITEDEKQILDLVHLRKIQESEASVLITNESKYVGFSTKREMQWSTMNKKHIMVIRNQSDLTNLIDFLGAGRKLDLAMVPDTHLDMFNA